MIIAAIFALVWNVNAGSAAAMSPAAQSAIAVAGQWDSVMMLPVGAQVEIQGRDAHLVHGAVEAVDAQQIIIVVRDGRVTMSRTSIARVVKLGGRQIGRYAKRGFLIGGALGVAHGLATVKSNRAPWIAFLAGMEGGVGAVVGAVYGARAVDRTVIYVALTEAK